MYFMKTLSTLTLALTVLFVAAPSYAQATSSDDVIVCTMEWACDPDTGEVLEPYKSGTDYCSLKKQQECADYRASRCSDFQCSGETYYALSKKNTASAELAKCQDNNTKQVNKLTKQIRALKRQLAQAKSK